MFTRPKRPTLSIDMAPLIDVVFLLLIFFMLTSNFVPPSVPLTLPKASSSAPSEATKLIVSLDQNGQISISDQIIPDADFESALRSALEQNSTTAVHFRGDTSVDYGVFLKLISRARNAGANQFHLVHDSATNP
jgi:biopolymer transport protein ExbD